MGGCLGGPEYEWAPAQCPSVLQPALPRCCPFRIALPSLPRHLPASPPSPPPPDPAADAEGIDASIAGIAKRVVVLLLGLSGLGTVLFYLGLKYAFPDSIY